VRRHSPAVGALLQIAMKTKWLGSTAVAMEPWKPGYA